MIIIAPRFQIRPEDADQWPQIAAESTGATRGEPRCLWFDWSRSPADPEEYVLVEVFRHWSPTQPITTASPAVLTQ